MDEIEMMDDRVMGWRWVDATAHYNFKFNVAIILINSRRFQILLSL